MKKLIATLFCSISLLIAGCATAPEPDYFDVPPKVVSWAADNVWKVVNDNGSGTGFSINEDTVITACHVVRNNRFPEVPIYLINDRDTRLVFVEMVSCNKETDIAVLKRTGGDALNSTFQGFHARPQTGKRVWGAGHAMGGPLLTTTGHVGFITTNAKIRVKDAYFITAPTVPGDSGSPVIAMYDGVPVVVGIRVAVRVVPMGFTGSNLAWHMVIVASTKSILSEIHKDVEGYE